jgi:hypothetical protein
VACLVFKYWCLTPLFFSGHRPSQQHQQCPVADAAQMNRCKAPAGDYDAIDCVAAHALFIGMEACLAFRDWRSMPLFPQYLPQQVGDYRENKIAVL